MQSKRFVSALSTVLMLGISTGAVAVPADDWPTFRGLHAGGVADGHALPGSWDPASGHNVLWVVPVPGASHASPIVWGDRIYVVTSVAEDPAADRRETSLGNRTLHDDAVREWQVLAFDRSDGTMVWADQPYRGAPRVPRHEKASHLNSTPATDGRFLVAVFASEGMVCYDLDGTELWRRDLGQLDTGLWGDPSNPWGHGSSPVIHDDLVIIQSDRYEDSFLAAFRLSDGEPVWRAARSEKNTWSTPTLHRVGGRTLVVTNGGNHNRAYDADTGAELWSYADEAEVKVPTPVVAGGRVILAGGWPQGRPIHAVAVDASGEVADTPGQGALAWRVDQGGPYTTTPVVYRGVVYSVTDNGIASAYDLETGERLFRERLRGGFSASPVAGDGKVYFSSEDGEVFVLAAGSGFELVSEIDMAETIFASPAISEGTIYLRTAGRLYALAAADGGGQES
jgi:outer membrane protein assembly factor BamB